jgi:hypothetical protein
VCVCVCLCVLGMGSGGFERARRRVCFGTERRRRPPPTLARPPPPRAAFTPCAQSLLAAIRLTERRRLPSRHPEEGRLGSLVDRH